MDTIQFFCQQCGNKIQVEKRFAGRTGKCLACKAAFTVPAANAPVTTAPPSSPLNLMTFLKSNNAPVPTEPMPVAMQQPVPPTPPLAPPLPAATPLQPPPPLVPMQPPSKPADTFANLKPIQWFKAQTPAKQKRATLITAFCAAGMLLLVIVSAGVVHLFKMQGVQARSDRMITDAKDAHDGGDVEGALNTLQRVTEIDGWENLPNDIHRQVNDLEDSYKRELGQKRAPELADLIAKARAAIKADDKPKAIDLLAQATAPRYRDTPGHVEAEELLKTVEPPEPPPAPAAPPTPAEASKPVAVAPASGAGATRLDVSGSGTKTTEKFTVTGDWDLVWSYDQEGFGQNATFAVWVYNADGTPSDILPLSQLGKRGSDIEHNHIGGTYYLEVISIGTWRIQVKQR